MASPDILLVAPPFDFSEINSAGGRRTRQAGYYLYYPPLGLCSIAAALDRAGYSVGIIDGQVDAGSEAALVEMIAAAKPRLLGVSVTTPALPVVRRLARAVRERLDVAVVAGGPHVSCDPLIIDALGADYGVVGDGEPAMVAIAGAVLRGEPLSGGEPGIIKSGATAPPEPSVADLNSLPDPARALLRSPDAYFNPFVKARTTTLLSARGCPFQCSFCCRTLSMGAYRPVALGRVLEEMERVACEGCGFVSIIDETFTYDRDRAIELAREMKKRGPGFRWSCQTRADLADEEALREFKHAGCINISFGIESGDPSVRDAVDKRLTDNAIESAFAACHRAGITINAFMIIGAPDETAAQVRRTIERAVELEPDYVVFNIGTLFPGTREYEMRVAAGEVDRAVWDDYARGESPMPVLSRRLGRDELADWLRRGYSKFYLRPGYVLKKLGSVRSARDILVLARQARTVVADYVVS